MLKKEDKPVVAVTLMGVTNNGAVAAVEELERAGLEVIGFHATGVGGATMEKIAEEGLVDGIWILRFMNLQVNTSAAVFPMEKLRIQGW